MGNDDGNDDDGRDRNPDYLFEGVNLDDDPMVDDTSPGNNASDEARNIKSRDRRLKAKARKAVATTPREPLPSPPARSERAESA